VSSRLEKRLFRLNDEILRLQEEERLTAAELNMLEHLDDDARRDAAGGGPLERGDARESAADVARFRRTLGALQTEREALEAKRDRLLARLG
jgi:hypothetical protein